MTQIIVETLDYNDVIRIIQSDKAFLLHQIQAHAKQYDRLINKAKPKGKFALKPILIAGRRGINYILTLNNPSYTDYKNNGVFWYCFGYCRLKGGFYAFHIVEHKGKPDYINVYTPHFFQRYKERILKDPNTPANETMCTFFKNNQRIYTRPQNNDKHPNGVFLVSTEIVAFGIETDNYTEIKTCVSVDMLKGDQIPERKEMYENLMLIIDALDNGVSLPK